MSIRHILLTATMLAGQALVVEPAPAQDFPSRGITVVVPYTAGGTTDVNTRQVAARVSAILGQQVIVENRAGGAAQIAAVYVKRAAPDGYILMIADLHTHVINAVMNKALSYDPIKDFEPITLLWNYPTVVTVPASSPAKNMVELVDFARKTHKGLSFASQGVGTTGHLMPEKIKFERGVNLVHVPYKGVAEATNDLVAGQVDFLFAGVNATVIELARSGKLRFLAVTDSRRAELLPDIPTMEEAGFPGYVSRLWAGLVAPSGTPANVIARLNTAFITAINDPTVSGRLAAAGTRVDTSTPSEFAAVIKTDEAEISTLVRQAGIPTN